MSAPHAGWLAPLALPGLARAAGGDPARAESAAAGMAGGGMLMQLTLGLVVVLVLAVGLSWLLRRYALPRDGVIRVIGGLPLGSRERLLLVEVDATRLLLGITPQQIRTLHVFAAATSPPADPTPFRIAPPPPSESSHDAPRS
jgi:flagellar protein FliO/FliZ